jgi:hypothetical protein
MACFVARLGVAPPRAGPRRAAGAGLRLGQLRGWLAPRSKGSEGLPLASMPVNARTPCLNRPALASASGRAQGHADPRHKLRCARVERRALPCIHYRDAPRRHARVGLGQRGDGAVGRTRAVLGARGEWRLAARRDRALSHLPRRACQDEAPVPAAQGGPAAVQHAQQRAAAQGQAQQAQPAPAALREPGPRPAKGGARAPRTRAPRTARTMPTGAMPPRRRRPTRTRRSRSIATRRACPARPRSGSRTSASTRLWRGSQRCGPLQRSCGAAGAAGSRWRGC